MGWGLPLPICGFYGFCEFYESQVCVSPSMTIGSYVCLEAWRGIEGQTNAQDYWVDSTNCADDYTVLAELTDDLIVNAVELR